MTMRLHEMGTSMWAALLGIAITGLGHERAGAIEEVVVHGSRPAKTLEEAAPLPNLRDDMSAYLRALNAAQRARIDAALLQQRGQQIQIAATKIPTRS
jgi:hypothetical protein